MAYNREWDQGKGDWHGEGGPGNPFYGHNNDGTRGNVRYREEDYQSDGKRRRFDDGSNEATQSWDDASYQHPQHDYPRPAQPGAANAGPGAGAGGAAPHFNKKRMVPSEPSPHVIFLGLDPDFSEADLHSYLTQHGCSIETVTIIRERNTGQSKGFGFAQFSSTENARTFVDPSFPFIQVPPPASHGASATAAFWQALETGAQHTGRRVKIDYSQSANPADKNRFGRPGNSNDGTRDIGNTQAPVLLFRGLDPLSGPQAIHQAMKTSSGLHKDGAKGMKRIVLIKDKTTLASWGFAFVEFVDAQSASAVLAATMSPQIHPNGFRISDKPVAASFAHPFSFQPIANPMLRDEACMPSSMNMGGVEGQFMRYWDEGSTVATLEFKVEEPVQPAAPGKEKKKKSKAADAEAAALLAGPAEASTLPVSDKPVTLNFKGSLASSKPAIAATKAAPLTLGFSTDDLADEDEPSTEKTAADAKVAAAKKVAPMIASKKIANNINKWNQAQEVMTTGSSAREPSLPTQTTSAPVSVPKPILEDSKLRKVTPPPPPEVEFEFSDMVKLTCLLCARQFKAIDQLTRHNKESELHKKNYKDPNLRDIAREKAQAAKAKADSSEQSTPDPQAAQAKYRDRASERRVMHNQPDAPVPEGGEDKRKPRRFAEGPPPPPSPPAPVLNPAEDKSNVGNKLLKMMGWKEGTGLGVDGEGRVAPIQTAMFASGVGLGASKGKEVGKYQEGYTGYVNMAKDAARERYDA